MVYFRENAADGGEGSDQDRRNSSAEEGSSAGDEYLPSGSSGRRGLPVEGGDCDGDSSSACDDLERSVLQWLRALDLHVVGACRVHDRLKPLFNLNVSGGIAEDRLVAHLSQHFEATEIGTLARCLCVPLLSIRVGKVNKEGTLLCPTATKGYLQLALLPSSDMVLSFCGDSGLKESLAVVSHLAEERREVTVEEISADGSGRSFVLRLPKDRPAYFWCSEKSLHLGSELLCKMKDLLRRRPSLSQLTGISEQRLDSLAIHLRNFLPRPPVSTIGPPLSALAEPAVAAGFPSSSLAGASSSLLLPDSLPGGGEEGARRSPPPAGDPSVQASTAFSKARSEEGDGDKTRECSSRPLHDPPFYHLPEFPPPSSLSSCFHSSSSFPLLPPTAGPAPRPPLFSPYYCWCPSPPSLQSSAAALAPHRPPTPPEPLLLPPLPFASLELPEAGPLIFPPLPPFSSQPGKNQPIPTFTPFMSDPIVHVPVIDICSSGQGYLVSAGPAISSAVPSIVGPLLPEADSAAEKNARETLRMLIASAPSAPQLIEVLPAVLTSVGDGFPCLHGLNHGVLVAGSRGLYAGTKDVDAAARWAASPVGNPPAPPSAPLESGDATNGRRGDEAECSHSEKAEDASDSPGA